MKNLKYIFTFIMVINLKVNAQEAYYDNSSDLSLSSLSTNSEKGITVAFYSSLVNNTASFSERKKNEFERGAKLVSKYYKAIGLDKSGIVVTGEDAAMGIKTISSLLNKIDTLVNRKGKIKKLCIYTHGVLSSSGDYLNFGNNNIIKAGAIKNNKNYRKFSLDSVVQRLNNSLTSDAKIILYACVLGTTNKDINYCYNRCTGKNKTILNPRCDTIYNYKKDKTKKAKPRYKCSKANWSNARTTIRNDHTTNGIGSFAELLENKLNHNNTNRVVWAHRNTGHTYGNPNWRVFKPSETKDSLAGPFLFGDDSKKYNLSHSQKSIKLIRDKVKLKLKERGVSLDSTHKVNKALRWWICFTLPMLKEKHIPPITKFSNNSSEVKIKDGLIDWFVDEFQSTLQNQENLINDVLKNKKKKKIDLNKI